MQKLARTQTRARTKSARLLTTVLGLLLLLSGCGTSPVATPVPPTDTAPPPPTDTAMPPTATAEPPTPTEVTLAPTNTAQPSISLKPCTLASSIKAECGMYSVYEDREAQTGRKINLRVAVVRASNPDRQPDPMVYLSGGPGGAAVDDAKGIGAAFNSLNRQHDWLLVDQRGTGGSNALLFPPLPAELMDPAITPERAQAVLKDWMPGALKQLDGDPRFYTTSIAMDDVDEVAQALGYKQVNLYGGSYGATAVQYYLRQHGDHVRTAIMDGGTLVDIPIFEMIPANSQKALDKVFTRCEAEAACHSKFPNVRAEMQAVYDRLSKEPATVSTVTDPITQKPVVFRSTDFAAAVHSLLLKAQDAARVPMLVHRASLGDYDGLASMQAQNAAQQSQGGRQVMYWIIRCSEPWARDDPKELAVEGKGSYTLEADLLNAYNVSLACSAVPKGIVEPDEGVRVKSDVPVLLLNGDADPQDPPENVANAQKDLPNSLSLTVPGQGHGTIQYGCLFDIAQRFVNSGTTKGLDTGCLKDMPIPPFYTEY